MTEPITPVESIGIPEVSDTEKTPGRILIVDDEKVIREILSEFLTLEGFKVDCAEDGADAFSQMQIRTYDMVISDLKMPKMSGLDLLAKIQETGLDVLTVIMTGFGTVETAIEAMKNGAYDYILKPFKVEEVIHIVKRGFERRRLQIENVRLREALTIYKVSEVIASSLDLSPILDVILQAALDESAADVATLHLRDEKTKRFEERYRIAGENTAENPHTPGPPSPNMEKLVGLFDKGTPILASGPNAGRFFTETGSGVKNLQSFAAVPLQVATRVIGMLNVFSFTPGKEFDEGARKMLSILASRAASAIERAQLYDDLIDKNSALTFANQSLEENFQQTVVGFAEALEESDHYTRGHSERVALYAELIAEGMTLPDHEVKTIVKAGLMHDIGKIGIRYDMLNKPSKLTPEEVAVFRRHPEKGKRILDPIPCMRNLVDGCWCHHERFDGEGYPRKLKGDTIPIMGRIVAIADAYDAMTSDRAYRKALRHNVAVAEIKKHTGTQFDPAISELFLAKIEEHRTFAKAKGDLALVPP